MGSDEARLFRTVREEMGASYGLTPGRLPVLPDQQLLLISGAVPPERAGEVVDVVRAEAARLAAEGLEAEEFAAIKTQIDAQFDQLLADPSAVRDMILLRLARDQDADPDAVRADLTALTLDEANAALADLIAPGLTAIVATPDPAALHVECTVASPEDAVTCD